MLIVIVLNNNSKCRQIQNTNGKPQALSVQTRLRHFQHSKSPIIANLQMISHPSRIARILRGTVIHNNRTRSSVLIKMRGLRRRRLSRDRRYHPLGMLGWREREGRELEGLLGKLICFLMRNWGEIMRRIVLVRVLARLLIGVTGVVGLCRIGKNRYARPWGKEWKWRRSWLRLIEFARILRRLRYRNILNSRVVKGMARKVMNEQNLLLSRDNRKLIISHLSHWKNNSIKSLNPQQTPPSELRTKTSLIGNPTTKLHKKLKIIPITLNLNTTILNKVKYLKMRKMRKNILGFIMSRLLNLMQESRYWLLLSSIGKCIRKLRRKEGIIITHPMRKEEWYKAIHIMVIMRIKSEVNMRKLVKNSSTNPNNKTKSSNNNKKDKNKYLRKKILHKY